MAVHTKHPVSAPPAAPAREKTGHLLLRAWCIFVLTLAIAGVSWANAFGAVIAAGITVAAAAVSVALWIVIRPPVQWRRFPWYALVYVAFAAVSVLWSVWPLATVLTWSLLALTTLQALFVGGVLTWHELIRAVSSALQWVLSLSLLFELFVSVVVQHPVMPQFAEAPDGVDPIVYWSRDNLFDGGRIQGVFGNANLLAMVAVLAIVVFAVRYAAQSPRRPWQLFWIALAAYLLVRAGSATAYLALAGAVLVLATVLLMRTTKRPGERTKYYVAYAAVGLGGALALWFGRDAIFAALGRDSDLTGREMIWDAVLARVAERPWAGWGYSTPWLPWEARIDGWIVDHDQTVMQAHSMWVDVLFQLGIIGLVLVALAYFAFVWRSWFFAVDRPRWDLRDDRPYTTLSLVPTLTGAILLVQGFSESNPLMLWGWMFVVMFAYKIKQSPHVGEGPIELRLAIERGDLMKQEP
ncbi:O-antigen ligase family protein [Microbacterium xanthum]|uniref:O-antigen ligase family protein n=1 Tax=Microbacterium xanthum TaxID=3079794 RepID=UPI002AD5AF85|nr:O-antigen ligase family protein [Microbacterium sp. KSW-48]MDZ8171072.1 O-antigen ligase family protein [Microbacterium sp. KSW-48]